MNVTDCTVDFIFEIKSWKRRAKKQSLPLGMIASHMSVDSRQTSKILGKFTVGMAVRG